MTMTDTTSTELALLQGARLKGRLTPETAAVFVGDEGQALLQELEARGLLKAGAAGARLTPEGRERLASLLGEEREAAGAGALTGLYAEFDEPNHALKEVVTAWQLRPGGTVNDHSDADYDREVLGRVEAVHAVAAPLVERIAAEVPRLATYSRRLAAALARLDADHRFLANPLVDSYHQVWFELHEDLLGLLGLDREDEAKAGRA
nr:hypothetical protein [Candidatus Protofrankia californiensis]